MKVGVVGCGNIGADLCIALQKGNIAAEIVALTDIDTERAKILQRSFQLNAAICGLEENVAQCDFVVECAVAGVVKDVVESSIRHCRDCLILSVVGLIEHLELLEKAKENNIQIRIPSGALSGLDGILAAMEAGLHRVTLTTRKPPKGLQGAPFLVTENIDLEGLTEQKVLFEGNALEAAKAFPADINVAGALSILGVGPVETQVRVVADPNATENTHEVLAEGAFGSLQTITRNLPSPRNPKSSYLASLSAIAELRKASVVYATHHAVKLQG